METKEFRITIPDGYEIDKDNSTFECIKFKPKDLTYDDVAKAIFSNGEHCYYIKGSTGCIEHTLECNVFNSNNPNNAKSKEQLEKLFAINKLMNVAKYLNGDWTPCWGSHSGMKWYIYINGNYKIDITWDETSHTMQIYFKTKELAQQAIYILGNDTISLALSTDW